MAYLNCKLPDELKREVDIISAQDGVDIQDIICDIVQKFVKQRKKKDNGKSAKQSS